MSGIPFEVRAFDDAPRDNAPHGDRPFVAKSWLRAYERAHHTADARHRAYLASENRRLGALLKDAYYIQHGRVVNELLDTSTTLVAHFAGDADHLMGFACGEKHPSGVAVVHFVYTKNTYRKNGIARRLVDELLEVLGEKENVVASHTTDQARPLFMRLRWPYVPYPAFVAREGRSAA